MALENSINLLKARGNETVISLDAVIDAIMIWQEIVTNPDASHLIDFVRVAQASKEATNAMYKLEQHANQYRKLALGGTPPRLVEVKA